MSRTPLTEQWIEVSKARATDVEYLDDLFQRTFVCTRRSIGINIEHAWQALLYTVQIGELSTLGEVPEKVLERYSRFTHYQRRRIHQCFDNHRTALLRIGAKLEYLEIILHDVDRLPEMAYFIEDVRSEVEAKILVRVPLVIPQGDGLHIIKRK